MLGWEQLIVVKDKPRMVPSTRYIPKDKPRSIAEFAVHSSKQDVMHNHGWFYYSDGTYRWHSTRTSEPCVSGCQLAIYFKCHDEWLERQKI